MASFFDNLRETMANSESVSRKLADSTQARKDLKNDITKYLKYSEDEDDRYDGYYNGKSLGYLPFTLSRIGKNGPETRTGLIITNPDDYIIGAELDSGESLAPRGIKKFINDSVGSGWVFDFAENGSATNNDRKKFIRNRDYKENGDILFSSNPLEGARYGNSDGTGPFKVGYGLRDNSSELERLRPALEFIRKYRGNGGN